MTWNNYRLILLLGYWNQFQFIKTFAIVSISVIVSYIIVIAGFIAMYATLASRDVDLCLIPESPFYLEGEGGLFEYVEKRLKEDGHMVIVIAEGAGQDLLDKEQSLGNAQDASGNKLLADNGLWISQKIKVFALL